MRHRRVIVIAGMSVMLAGGTAAAVLPAIAASVPVASRSWNAPPAGTWHFEGQLASGVTWGAVPKAGTWHFE